MGLFVISLVNICNFNCDYCCAQQSVFRNQSTCDDFINIDQVINYLDKFIDPKQFMIQITGGEPTLHPDFEKLLTSLINRNYYGSILTNGSNIIPKQNNFVVVTTWHGFWKNEIPKSYDILYLPDIGNEEYMSFKMNFCEKHNIPHAVMNIQKYDYTEKPSNIYNQTKQTYNLRRHRVFNQMITMWHTGELRSCYNCSALRSYSNSHNRSIAMQERQGHKKYIQNMNPPKFRIPCNDCCIVGGVEDIMDLLKRG